MVTERGILFDLLVFWKKKRIISFFDVQGKKIWFFDVHSGHIQYNWGFMHIYITVDDLVDLPIWFSFKVTCKSLIQIITLIILWTVQLYYIKTHSLQRFIAPAT